MTLHKMVNSGLCIGMFALLSSSAQAIPLLDPGFEVLPAPGIYYYSGPQALSWTFGGVPAATIGGSGPGTLVLDVAGGFGNFAPPAVGQWLGLQSLHNELTVFTRPTVSQSFINPTMSDLTLTLNVGGRSAGATGNGLFSAFLDPTLDGNGRYLSGGQLFGSTTTLTGSSTAFSGTLTGVSAGAHTLALTFLGNPGDQTAVVDNVVLTAGGAPELNAHSAWLPIVFLCGLVQLSDSRRRRQLAVAKNPRSH